MIVFRVEHSKSGDGPYLDDFIEEWGGHLHTSPKHPEWEEDSPQGSLHWDYFFGFESLESLKSWFSPTERSKLHELGLVVSVYETSSYFLAKSQMVFDRSRLNKKLSLLEI